MCARIKNSYDLSMSTTLLIYTEDSEVLGATKGYHTPLRTSDKSQPGGERSHPFFPLCSRNNKHYTRDTQQPENAQVQKMGNQTMLGNRTEK